MPAISCTTTTDQTRLAPDIASAHALQWQLPSGETQQPSGRDSYQASFNAQRPGQPSQRQPANASVNRGVSLPADVRAGLDAGLQSTHRARVQSLADRLRSHSDLQGDEILAALKQHPATAAHAEARWGDCSAGALPSGPRQLQGMDSAPVQLLADHLHSHCVAAQNSACTHIETAGMWRCLQSCRETQQTHSHSACRAARNLNEALLAEQQPQAQTLLLRQP